VAKDTTAETTAEVTAPRVASFELDDLPKVSTVPPKYDADLLAQYVSLIEAGKAAGDGVAYGSQKEARSAANSIKRSLRKFVDTSTRIRVWQTEEGFMFALLENTVPLTGSAAAAAANKAR
jgi:hypothetical protein